MIWGLTHPDDFNTYFSRKEKEQREREPEYKKAGLAVDYIPTLNQILREGEEILKNYEKQIRTLSPIPKKVLNEAHTLNIKFTDI